MAIPASCPVIDDVILFDSWGGQYSDNPRAISEAMHRREVGPRQCWVLADGTEGPEWADRVAPGSDAHFALLGRARLVVANNLVPPFAKAAGTFHLQTWHGTPLKRIGFDLPDVDPGYLEHLDRERRQWDLLLSPSPTATPHLRSAFRYDGPVLESGYPRNDGLVEEHRGLRTVLYAPTFREQGAFDLRLDVAALADELDVDVLLRLHHFAPDARTVRHPRVRDVTDHPDLRGLLLTADALITDYSSVMVDFALTGRPIVLFADDLADYADGYLDFEHEAPGPVVATTEAVVDALRDPASWRERHAAFRRTYCALEDGRAADRVIEALLSASR